MARAIRERSDDIRDLYAPQVVMPSYAPSQAPDGSAKIHRALGTVSEIANSPLLGVLLRGGQALKGAYDESMVKAAADRRAARMAAGAGAESVEGQPELMAPVDTSRQLTSFEERPAAMPEGQDFSRGLAAARGVQFMPAVGTEQAAMPAIPPTAAAAQRRFNEVGPNGEAPQLDPYGHMYAKSNKLGDIQREGLEFEANTLRDKIANAPVSEGEVSQLGDVERRLAEMDRSPDKPDDFGYLNQTTRSLKTDRPWNAAMDKWVERETARRYTPPADNTSLGMRLDGPTSDRNAAVRGMTFGQEPVSVMPSTAGLAGVRRDQLLPAESTEGPREFKGADVAAGLQGIERAGLEPERPAPLSGMSLRKAPMALSDATDDQLAAVRSRLVAQADDPVAQQRLAKIDAELKDREDRRTVENGPISREQIMERARLATTGEEQAQVLRDLERVQAPITSLADLLGDEPKRRLQHEVVSLFPSAPKKSMEEILAEAEKDRAMAEMYRAKGRGEDLRAPAEAAKAGAAAGKYGAQTKTIDAMRDPTVENMRAKTANLAAGTDKIRAQIARIKAQRAAGAYGGAGGAGKLKDDIAYLKTLQDGQSKDVSDAKAEFDKMDVAAANADKAASEAISKLRAIGNPGSRPADAPKNADERLQVERSKEIAAWELKNQAYQEARALADQEVANRDNYRRQRDEAKQAMREAARASEARYNPSIEAVKKRINKRMGLNVPPAATQAPAAQPTAEPGPMQSVVEGVSNFFGSKSKKTVTW